MTGRGNQTSMPRAALPHGADRTGAAIFWIAFGISAVAAILEVVFIVTAAPATIALYNAAGVDLPAILQLMNSLGPVWTVVMVTVIDFSIFFLAWAGARRWWVGLLYVPPLIYVLFSFALFVALFAEPILDAALG